MKRLNGERFRVQTRTPSLGRHAKAVIDRGARAPAPPAQDVIPSVQGERAELRRQWELTFASTTRGVAIVDPVSDLIESVNLTFAAMHGGAPEDFVGVPSVSLVSPAWQSWLGEIVQRAGRSGHISQELDHVRLDGTSFPVTAEAITTRDSGGEPLFRIVWVEDLTDRRAAAQASREAHETFEAAFADAPNGVALISLDQRFVRVNAALCEMLGRSSEELIGTDTSDYCHADDLAATRGAYSDLSAVTDPVSIEKRYVRPDRSVVWAFCRGIVVRDGSGDPRYIVTHFVEMTARKLAEERQAEAYARFETAFADAPIGMALVTLDGRWIKVNRTLCEITGYSEAELLKRSFREITHPDDLSADLEQLKRLIGGEIDRYAMEKRYITAQCHELWINLAVSLVRDTNGQPVHVIRQSEDISERKRLQASLQYLADHDSLTGLWNRRRFDEELHRQIGRCQRYGERAALLLLDLNGFKAVNDTYGHKAGDDLLTHIASGLRERLRRTDSLARLGGDEFSVMLANVGLDQATVLAQTLRQIVSATTICVNGTEVGVTTSIGTQPLDASTASDQIALAQADAAMYADKTAGRRSAQEALGQPAPDVAPAALVTAQALR